MRVLGIDLASQPAGTAACLIDPDDPQAGIALFEGLDDGGLMTLAGAAEVIAIDAPLGWPSAFVAAVSAHARSCPLSVTSDRIAMVAFRAARLATALRPDDPAKDGSSGLLEVHPAALARWGLPHRGYKRPESTAGRSAIMEGLSVLFGIDLVTTRTA